MSTPCRGVAPAFAGRLVSPGLLPAFLLGIAVLLASTEAGAERIAGDPGLVGEYFRYSYSDPLVFVGWRYDLVPGSPAATEFNFPNGYGHGPWGNLDDMFQVRWTGYLHVPQTGQYSFQMDSDDVSWIMIDINDDGMLEEPSPNGQWTVTWNDLPLAEGFHAVIFQARDYGGGEWSSLRWQTPFHPSLYYIPASFFSATVVDIPEPSSVLLWMGAIGPIVARLCRRT